MSEKIVMSIPYLFGMIVFGLVYWMMMVLIGPFASMIVGPVLGIIAAVAVFLFSNRFFENIRHSND